MDVAIFVPIGLFAAIVLGIWVVLHFGLRRRQEAYQTIRLAIEKGQVVTPETMESLAMLANPKADLRRGVIFVAIAVSIAAFAGILSVTVTRDEPEAMGALLGIAVFPLFLGLSFLGLHFFASDRKH